MIVQEEQRIIKSASGNLLNRKYRQIKNAKNRLAALSAVNFGVAANYATSHKPLATIFFAGLTMLCLKATELSINAMRLLKPQYKEFLDRAKNINNIRKLNIKV